MKKNKNYYAIKKGKNVSDFIVETWEECSRYVSNYNAVYKTFKRKRDAESYLADMSQESLDIQLKIVEMQRILNEIERIRPYFAKNTPEYILTEIARVKVEGKKDSRGLSTALAVATGNSITKEEAKKIRDTYVSLYLSENIC